MNQHPAARSSGASARTCSPSRPTAPSATSGSAGPATSGLRRPPPAFNVDVQDYLDKWLQTTCATPSAPTAPSPTSRPTTCCGDGHGGLGRRGRDRAVRAVAAATATPRVAARSNYDAMTRWVDYLQRQRRRDLIRPNSGYGDWLNVDDNTAAGRHRHGVLRLLGATGPRMAAQALAHGRRTRRPTRSLYGQIRNGVHQPLGRAPTARSAAAARPATCSRWRSGSSRTTCAAAAVRPARRQDVANRGNHLSIGFLGTGEPAAACWPGRRPRRRRVPAPAPGRLPELGLHARRAAGRRSGSAGTASAPTARSRTPA